MNKLLVSMSNMLAFGGKYEDKFGAENAWLGKIVDIILGILPYVLIVLATLGIIYAVILAVNMAKAEDAGKREEAKKRIINFVIGIVIGVVLVLLLYIVLDQLPNWLGWNTAG